MEKTGLAQATNATRVPSGDTCGLSTQCCAVVSASTWPIGIFEALRLVLDLAHHHEVLAVGRPVGVFHVLEHFARNAARHLRAGQGTNSPIMCFSRLGLEGKGELPRARDGEELRGRSVQRERLRLSGRLRKSWLGRPSQAAL
jgi:hypothetical protein